MRQVWAQPTELSGEVEQQVKNRIYEAGAGVNTWVCADGCGGV